MTAKPDPRSGLDAEGNWTPAFERQRPPFRPGHSIGRPPEHGAYAELALSGRTQAFIERLREAGADHLTPADEPALAVAALSAVQLSCATGALEEVTEAIERGDDIDQWLGRLESRARLSQDSRRWSDTVRRWFDSLGLTAVGRAQLQAAQQPPGLPAHEVHELFSAFVTATLEFVDRVRRDEFLRRIDAVSAHVIGELPSAETVDAGHEAKP